MDDTLYYLEPIDKQPHNANTQLKSNFANSGRIAGYGIIHDDYGDEGGGKVFAPKECKDKCRLPSDGMNQEEWEKLNSPIVIIKPGKEVCLK